MAKVNAEQILMLRERGLKTAEIAGLFKCTPSCISKCIHRHKKQQGRAAEKQLLAIAEQSEQIRQQQQAGEWQQIDLIPSEDPKGWRSQVILRLSSILRNQEQILQRLSKLEAVWL